MTVREYVDGNNPFYHITNMDNLNSIREGGLLASSNPGSRHGICVVRSMEDDIINEIIDRQLSTLMEERQSYAIIRLLPKNHDIATNEVSKDPINEVIAPMCNYICKEHIPIQDVDIIKRDIQAGLWRETTTEIIELTEYQREPPHINR